ncbi:MAG TPA: DUF6683 family protein [Pyrinomonadaceae bacterium]|nr:DUF6683 family protein [Pyrinomonadaceae bacterium]
MKRLKLTPRLTSHLPPRLLLAAASLVVVAGSGTQTHAQFDTTTMTNDFLRMQNLIITQGISRENLRAAKGRAKGKNSPARSPGGGASRSPGGGTPKSGGATKGTTPTHTGATTFRPVAAQLVPQELARAVSEGAQERARYERFFTELLDGYKERLRRRGSPENDVARAASFLISESYFVYADGRSLDEEQFAALAAQVREALERDAEFTARTDREKQQMYERYAIKGSFLGLGYTLMKQNGDAKTLSGLRDLAKRQLEEMLGSRAEEISFTSDGVEYR